MATIEGTAGADTLGGTGDADTINGQGGNDTLTGLGGNDRVVGGTGADSVSGGDGNDRLYSHTVVFSPSEEFDPYAYARESTDILAEADVLNGAGGDDRIFAGYGDAIDGGSGTDSLHINFRGAASGVTADFRLLATQTSIVVGGVAIAGIESTAFVEGSNFNDVLGAYQLFPDEDAIIYGHGGDDQIFVTLAAGIYGAHVSGDDGNDLIDARGHSQGGQYYGGAGNDTIYTDQGYSTVASGGDGDDTLYSWDVASGDAGNDIIVMAAPINASPGTPRAYGEDGNDQISAAAGAAGDHHYAGGAGADVLNGGSGNDFLASTVFTGNGIAGEDNGTEQDQLSGGGGGDHLSIGYGDSANGGADVDVLQLSLAAAPGGVTLNTGSLLSAAPFVIGGGTIQNIEFIDKLFLTNFADTVTIGPASATPLGRIGVFGGNGNDTFTDTGNYVDVIGGDGDDRFVAAALQDYFFGGAGTDTVDYGLYASGVTVSLEYGTGTEGGNLADVENVDGTAHADSLTGNFAANLLEGNNGADALSGLFGNDTLDGGAGDDELDGGEGDDTLTGGAGTDSARFSSASAGVTVNLSLAVQATGQGTDTFSGIEGLIGSGFNDSLTGNGSANRLEGAAGNDTLNGGAGIDTLLGGLGNDTLIVDGAGDVVIENAGEGTDTLVSPFDTLLGNYANVENLTLAAGSGNRAGTGTAIGNVITGNEGANTLNGGAGGDLLVGGDGNDTLIGGLGSDAMNGGLGDDLFYVDSANDTITEAAGGGIDRVFAGLSYTLTAGAQVERLTTDNNAAVTAINLTGNELANVIYGNAGANVLNGKAGADALLGLGGNDTYYVDNALDTVGEVAGGGTDDRVFASVSYTLGAGVQAERLAAIDSLSTAAINLTGNELANTIIGNAGANVLNGKAGADTMSGLAGDDWYYVDNAADVIVEGAGQGALDRVLASVSYALGAGVQAERLTTTDNAGTAAINLTGNELVNVIYGNAGSNTLDGKGGADAMVGLGGDDRYFVDSASDAVVETAGGGANDRILASVSYTLAAGSQVERLTTIDNNSLAAINLTGNEFANLVYGNAGANVIDGGGGADMLFGLAGADSFRFATALGAGNVDAITDFVAADDTIQLENAVFTGLAAGALAAGAFNTGTAATQADDRVIHDAATGALLFDADGLGGAAAVQFATVAAGLALTPADFVVI